MGCAARSLPDSRLLWGTVISVRPRVKLLSLVASAACRKPGYCLPYLRLASDRVMGSEYCRTKLPTTEVSPNMMLNRRFLLTSTPKVGFRICGLPGHRPRLATL